MSVASILLNAQRRPEDEARRVVAAIADAFDAGGQSLDIATVSEAAAASDRANFAIAEEKTPRLIPPPVQHREQFYAPEPDGFTGDEQETQVDTHRTDQRYLLEDFSIPATQNTSHVTDDESDEDVWSQNPAPTAWSSESEDVTHAFAEPGPLVNPIEPISSSAESNAPANSYVLDPKAAASPDDPYADPYSSNAHPTPQSPWGDSEEIIATEHSNSEPEEQESPGLPMTQADVEPADPTPSGYATIPPSRFMEPEPEPEPSLFQRLRRGISEQLYRARTNPMRTAKIFGLGVGALLLVAAIVLSFSGGGRGKPPDPAGTVAAPPPEVDNTTAPNADGPLVPATVSASCGDDSDAVAPFSHDKTRAWVCSRINGMDLNVLNITFNKPVAITSITVVPGFNYVAPDGRDEWSRHRLVTAVSWRMGGSVYEQNIAPTRTGVTKQFPSVCTLQMSMTITASTRPPVGKDPNSGISGSNDASDPKKIDETTAISKIVINGSTGCKNSTGSISSTPTN